MDEPIVESLTYKLVMESHPLVDVQFAARSPLDWSTDLFAAHLENDTLVVQPKLDLSESDAREQVERFLRAWSVEAGLAAGRPVFTFRYSGSRTARLNAEGRSSVGVSLEMLWNVKEVCRLEDYPPPPAGFAASPLVDVLWTRYSAYKKGQETLAAMAYACLCIVKNAVAPAGGTESKESSGAYGISENVLRKLGMLTSDVGNPETSRKAPRQPRRYTPREVAWIEAAVIAMMRQAGRKAFNPEGNLPAVTMADLPALSPPKAPSCTVQHPPSRPAAKG